MKTCDFSDGEDDGRAWYEDPPDDESEGVCGLCREAPAVASAGDFERRLAVCRSCVVSTLMPLAARALGTARDKDAALRRARESFLSAYEYASGDLAAGIEDFFKRHRRPGP